METPETPGMGLSFKSQGKERQPRQKQKEEKVNQEESTYR